MNCEITNCTNKAERQLYFDFRIRTSGDFNRDKSKPYKKVCRIHSDMSVGELAKLELFERVIKTHTNNKGQEGAKFELFNLMSLPI